MKSLVEETTRNAQQKQRETEATNKIMRQVEKDAMIQFRGDVSKGDGKRSELNIQVELESQEQERKKKAAGGSGRVYAGTTVQDAITGEDIFVVKSSRIGEWVNTNEKPKNKYAKGDLDGAQQSSSTEAYVREEDDDTEQLDKHAFKEKVVKMDSIDEETVVPVVFKKRKIAANTRRKE